jgi:hypothetical protein
MAEAIGRLDKLIQAAAGEKFYGQQAKKRFLGRAYFNAP